MNNLTKNNLTKLAALAGMVFFGTGLARATPIPPTISTTLTITTNSHLTSDVSCTVTGAPCIKFGAPGIKLKLNGFKMTGNGGQNSCTFNAGETGIDTNGKNNVSIQGPGLVRRFNDIGIAVSGNHSSVEGVAITSFCEFGILVSGSHNEVEGNSISRAFSSGSSPVGISLFPPGGSNKILNNEDVGGGFGIFVGIGGGAPSNNNLIEENNVSGNSLAGIIISSGFPFRTKGSTGNTVRRNQVLGNLSGDISDFNNDLPANTYDNNLCEVSRIGPSAVNICQLPNIAGHQNGPVDRN